MVNTTPAPALEKLVTPSSETLLLAGFSFYYYYFFIFNFFLNVYLLWGVRSRERERERERERIPSRLHAISAEPNVGLDLTNHEITT